MKRGIGLKNNAVIYFALKADKIKISANDDSKKCLAIKDLFQHFSADLLDL